MKITLRSIGAGQFVLESEDGRSVHCGADYDHCGIAGNFGWRPCECGSTDGTVDCPDCGRKAGDMIAEATAVLYDHDGDSFEDPGYFDGAD